MILDLRFIIRDEKRILQQRTANFTVNWLGEVQLGEQYDWRDVELFEEQPKQPESAEEADSHNVEQRIACLHIKQKFVEGEGLDEEPKNKHIHNYKHRNRAVGDTYFCDCGDSY